MHNVRFTIGGLMAVVLVAAIGFAALANPNESWAGVLLLLAYGLLGLAILGAVVGRQAARAWWLGGAVFEWGYLQMASGPWGSLSRKLPTRTLLEILRAKLVAAPRPVPALATPDDIAFDQIAHCLWALLAGILGATLARAIFALPAAPPEDPQAVGHGRGARRQRPWLRPAMMILVILVLVGTAVAIWSTPDEVLWAGGMYLLTCGLLGIAALGALFARGKSREICIGATLFGVGYLYMALGLTRFEYSVTDELLIALRPLIPSSKREITPANSRIVKALEQPIPMRFKPEASLGDVLTYIKMATSTPAYRVPIYVDPVALQEAEKSLSSTVSIDLQGVPLKASLRLCLKQLGLVYIVKDGYLQITNEDEGIPPSDVPFLIVGHSLLALLSAALGGVAAVLVSAACRQRAGRTAADEAPAPVASP